MQTIDCTCKHCMNFRGGLAEELVRSSSVENPEEVTLEVEGGASWGGTIRVQPMEEVNNAIVVAGERVRLNKVAERRGWHQCRESIKGQKWGDTDNAIPEAGPKRPTRAERNLHALIRVRQYPVQRLSVDDRGNEQEGNNLRRPRRSWSWKSEI